MSRKGFPRPPAVRDQEVIKITEVSVTDENPEISQEGEGPIIVDTPLPQERLVRIKMRKNHRTIIGGVVFNLQEGKIYRVTKEVRSILSNSPLDLLDPIVD